MEWNGMELTNNILSDVAQLARVVQEEFGTSAEGLAARKRVFDDRHRRWREATIPTLNSRTVTLS